MRRHDRTLGSTQREASKTDICSSMHQNKCPSSPSHSSGPGFTPGAAGNPPLPRRASANRKRGKGEWPGGSRPDLRRPEARLPLTAGTAGTGTSGPGGLPLPPPRLRRALSPSAPLPRISHPWLTFTPSPFPRPLEAAPQLPALPSAARPARPAYPSAISPASSPASPQGAASLRAAAHAPPPLSSRFFSRGRRGRCHGGGGGGGAGGGYRRGPGGRARRGAAGVSEGCKAGWELCRSGQRVPSSPPVGGREGWGGCVAAAAGLGVRGGKPLAEGAARAAAAAVAAASRRRALEGRDLGVSLRARGGGGGAAVWGILGPGIGNGACEILPG